MAKLHPDAQCGECSEFGDGACPYCGGSICRYLKCALSGDSDERAEECPHFDDGFDGEEA